MTPTHTRKPVNVRAFIFNGNIDCLDQDHVDAELLDYLGYDSSSTICEKCNKHFDDHAYIKTISGEAVVCPGDYIINNPQFRDDYYPCKPDIFESTYDNIEHKTSSVGACENTTNSNSSNFITDNEIRIISLKLDAAKTLIDKERNEGTTKVAVNFMKQLIEGTSRLEPVVDGMSFGEMMALINEDSEILVSRKAYDIDYIYFNSETNQFESYTNGVKTLHGFDTKDYTANDWYIVN